MTRHPKKVSGRDFFKVSYLFLILLTFGFRVTTNKFLQPGVCVLLKQWDSRAEIIILVNLFHIFKIPFHKNAFGGLLLYVSLNSNGDPIKRALHYLFNWAWFLEINKLCNVATKNLRFSTNRKFISLNWKV